MLNVSKSISKNSVKYLSIKTDKMNMAKGKKFWYNYSKIVWSQQKHPDFFMYHTFCNKNPN